MEDFLLILDGLTNALLGLIMNKLMQQKNSQKFAIVNHCNTSVHSRSNHFSRLLLPASHLFQEASGLLLEANGGCILVILT